MATISVAGTNAASVQLSIAQTGNADSTNIADRGAARLGKTGAIVINSTAGGTPTVTVNILGSADGVNFWNIPYALVATPATFVIAALTITTTVITTYLLQVDQPWQFVKLNYSANTNLTITATASL